MIIQKDVQLLIKDIAKKFNITYSEALEVINSQFEFVKKGMDEGDKGEFDSFPEILLRRLGTFTPSYGKFYHINKTVKKKKSNEESD